MTDIGTKETKDEALARLKDFEQSIANAAIGHAATLYEAQAAKLDLETPDREGYTKRFIRLVRAHCPHGCSATGIHYELNLERPVRITITECECVRYEVKYERLKDPQIENLTPEVSTTTTEAP